MADLFRREAEWFVPRDLLDGWDRGDVEDEELLSYVCGTVPTQDRWIMADGNLAWGQETYVPIAQRLLEVYRVVRMIERRDKERNPWERPARRRKSVSP